MHDHWKLGHPKSKDGINRTIIYVDQEKGAVLITRDVRVLRFGTRKFYKSDDGQVETCKLALFNTFSAFIIWI